MGAIAQRRTTLVLSFVASVLGFIWLNTWHVDACADCMIPRGRRFHYMITEGFATPGRYLWQGMLADCAVIAIATVCVDWLSLFLLGKTKAKRAQ